jgi:hypothetical protein
MSENARNTASPAVTTYLVVNFCITGLPLPADDTRWMGAQAQAQASPYSSSTTGEVDEGTGRSEQGHARRMDPAPGRRRQGAWSRGPANAGRAGMPSRRR